MIESFQEMYEQELLRKVPNKIALSCEFTVRQSMWTYKAIPTFEISPRRVIFESFTFEFTWIDAPPAQKQKTIEERKGGGYFLIVSYFEKLRWFEIKWFV